MKIKRIKINKNKIGNNILIMSLAISGIISLTSGAVLNKMEFKPNRNVKIKVIEKRIAKKKTNIPKLKDIEVEVNVPISVDIKDYIENLEEIDEKILKKFKLDTSLVNVTEIGTYTYTITYKDKKYNGNVTVKDKELPAIDNMTLKNINIEKGSSLPKNLNDYIVEDIPEDAKDRIIIDTSKVNINLAGTYQYTVKYKDKTYTGTITVFESQPQVIIKEEPENNEQNNSTNNNESTEQTPTTPPEQTNQNTSNENENNPSSSNNENQNNE